MNFTWLLFFTSIIVNYDSNTLTIALSLQAFSNLFIQMAI